MNLSALTVVQVRKACLSQESPSRELLQQLRNDPRQGVRQIHNLLMRRLDKKCREQQRIESMLYWEKNLWKNGVRLVGGVDEVGMGALAGPVVAAAVIFPSQIFIPGVDDSKRLSPKKRLQVVKAIKQHAIAFQVGSASVNEINDLNIYQASILAMQRAIKGLSRKPCHLLVDAKTIPKVGIPQSSIIKGDSLSFSIAAASIVAKTFRDQLMINLDRQYPQYGLRAHKGYGTPQHQMAIKAYGLTLIHRHSFKFS
jgi:ribonuclease HII